MAASDDETDWFLSHPPKLWPPRLRVDRADAVRFAVAVMELVLPEWRAARPGDEVPLRAVEVAMADPGGIDRGLRQHARVLARGCTESRRRSLGYEHRIAEAARSLAAALAADSDTRAIEEAAETLQKVEEHLLYTFAVAAVYGREAEVRARMLRCAVEAGILQAGP